MSGKHLYLLICCVMLSAQSYHINNTVCEGSLCLYLYKSDDSKITWDESFTGCKNENLEMLRIESSQTQIIVDRLLQDLVGNPPRQAWIGGHGSSDDTWKYMNGTEFHLQIRGNSDSNLTCVYVRLCKDRNPEYHADNCDEKRSTSRVFCQYDKSKTGECRQSGYQFGDKCYVKTPYDGSESNRTDWYSGQTYCSQSPIQGDLAYSYLDDNSSINSVLSLFNDSDGCAHLWLGVRRRIWFWRTVSDIDKQQINYFNWVNGTQIQPSYDNCIYVDGDNGNKWRTQSCNSCLPYFVCMKENPASSSTNSTSTSEATQLTLAATEETTAAGSSTAGSGDRQKVYVISMSVVGILILLGAVGLAVFCIRRKKKNHNSDKYVNEHFHKSLAKSTKADCLEYAEVEQNGSNHDDVIDPYGVTGGSEMTKKIKHSVAPSGDLYTLPRQKVRAGDIDAEVMDENSKSTSTVSGSKGREIKYHEAPSGDLYAVPEKKRNYSDGTEKT